MTGASKAPITSLASQPSRWQRRLGSRQEVADYLGVPVKTLVQWGHKSVGPPYKIIGRHARYDWEQVFRWIDDQRTGGGGAA